MRNSSFEQCLWASFHAHNPKDKSVYKANLVVIRILLTNSMSTQLQNVYKGHKEKPFQSPSNISNFYKHNKRQKPPRKGVTRRL